MNLDLSLLLVTCKDRGIKRVWGGQMKNKSLFLASAALACVPMHGTNAAPRMSPPAFFSWTGFYVGAHIGGVWGRSAQSVDVDTFGGISANNSQFSGVIGGLQAGYNYQVANFVFGIEGDYGWASAKSSVVTLGDTHNMALNSLATVRGRVGVAFDRFLPYVTGGVAFANLQNEVVDTVVPFGPLNRGSNATGWTIGGGGEYAFDPHWSVKAEYLYVQLPDQTASITGGGYTFQTTFKDSEQVARVGINYKF